MAEKRSSPYNFSNLDSSLIRSTKRTATPPTLPPAGDEAMAELVIMDEAHRSTPDQEATHHPQTHDTTNHATTSPRHHEPTPPRAHDPIVAEVQKAVTRTGRCEGTHRYTEEEKEGLDEMIRAFKRKRIRTSENEIARIGINYLLADYRRNGEQSFIAQVLASLHH